MRKLVGLLEFLVTTDFAGSPEAMVQPILHGSPSRAPAMPSPVASSTVMITSSHRAARILDYAKKMSAPTTDQLLTTFSETGRIWGSCIFHQLTG